MKTRITKVARSEQARKIAPFWTEGDQPLSSYRAQVLAKLGWLVVGQGYEEREVIVVRREAMMMPGDMVLADDFYLRAKPGGARLEDLPSYETPAESALARLGRMVMSSAPIQPQCMKAPPGYLEGLALGQALRASKKPR